MKRHSRLPFRHLISLGTLLGLFLFFLCQWGTSLQANEADLFPDTLALLISTGQPLTLRKTGESARKKFFFPVYRIAHYTDRQSGPVDILDYHGPKAVRMIFQRRIDGHRIEEEVKKAIRERVTPEEWNSLRDTATAFCKPYASGEVDAGDVYSVLWDTQGWLISQLNGLEISRLHDDRFARALWSIWVGQESLVNKSDLLGDWAKGS